MAATAPKRIVIESNNQPPMVKEALAGEAGIGPGDLLEYSTTVGTVLRHNTADGVVAPVMVAVEKWWNDDDDNYALDVDYADGDVLRYIVPQRGDVVYMWLASGENASALDYLVSDGDGALAVEAAIDATDIIHALVGIAAEAVDASAALSRIKVLIV
jgi:hypothetical protein